MMAGGRDRLGRCICVDTVVEVSTGKNDSNKKTQTKAESTMDHIGNRKEA